MIVKDFSAEDINTRVEWINNPAINKSMYFELPATIEKTIGNKFIDEEGEWNIEKNVHDTLHVF